MSADWELWRRVYMRTCLLCCLILSGCAHGQTTDTAPTSKPQLLRYAVNVVNLGWQVRVVINDEPAFCGGEMSGMYDCTPFVRNGVNRVYIMCRNARTGRPPSSCEVQLLFRKVEGDTIGTDIIGGLTRKNDDAQSEIEARLEFTAVVPIRWMYEDSDDVGELSEEDRSSIDQCIDEVVQVFEKRDAGAAARVGNQWTSNKIPPTPLAVR
jgi:hypothetical protein